MPTWQVPGCQAAQSTPVYLSAPVGSTLATNISRYWQIRCRKDTGGIGRLFVAVGRAAVVTGPMANHVCSHVAP